MVTTAFANANIAYSRTRGEHRCDDKNASERLNYAIYGQAFRRMSRAEIVDYLADNAQNKETSLSKVLQCEKKAVICEAFNIRYTHWSRINAKC